jgi:hypothetical protein
LPYLVFLGLLFFIFILIFINLNSNNNIFYKGLKAFYLIDFIFNFIFKSFIIDFNKYIIILFKSNYSLLKYNIINNSKLKLFKLININSYLLFFINYSKYTFKYNFKIILF